jgi:ribokinase
MSVIVIGDASIDHLIRLERLPAPGEELFAETALTTPGGAGANVAAHLAHLGHRVDLIARVGQDPAGRLLLEHLSALGLRLDHVQQDPKHPTTASWILIAGGERTMITAEGANRFLAELSEAVLVEAELIIISAYSLLGASRGPTLQLLHKALQRGLPVLADLGGGAVRNLGSQLLHDLRGISYLLLNEAEYQALGQEPLDIWRQRYQIQGLLLKRGARGALLVDDQGSTPIDAVPVEQVLDPTGAGDAFTAAFAHGLLAGWEPLRAARAAARAGARLTQSLGGQGHLLSPFDLVD